MEWEEVKQVVSMTSPVEVFLSSLEQLAVTGEAFVRKQINKSVVSQIVTQSVFKVLQNSDKISVAPKLNKTKKKEDKHLQQTVFKILLLLSNYLGWNPRMVRC